MRVVFKLEEVPGGIFEKECVVFNGRPRESHAGLLIEGQLVRLGLPQEQLPRIFRQEDEAEMVGVDASLRWPRFRRHMRHELMPCKPKHDGVARLTTQRAAKPIDIKAFRRRHIVYGES